MHLFAVFAAAAKQRAARAAGSWSPAVGDGPTASRRLAAGDGDGPPTNDDGETIVARWHPREQDAQVGLIRIWIPSHRGQPGQ